MTDSPQLPQRLIRRVAAEYHKHVLERDFARLVRDIPRPANASGPRVGFATFGSYEWHLVIELLLAHSVALRGARPELLICDLPELPICSERLITSRQRERCPGCIDGKRTLLESSGLPWRGVSDFVARDAVSRAEARVATLPASHLESHVERGWPIGEWLHVSGCHFLRCDARGDSIEKVDTRRRWLAAAIVTVAAVERWLDACLPDVVVVQSGAHVNWRIARELAQARGIPVFARELGKGGWDRHIYALNADCMAPDLADEWVVARDVALSASEDDEVDGLVARLPADTYAVHGAARPASGVSAPAGKRVAVAFTNVTWDLATAGRDVAFTGVFDWLKATIDELSQYPDAHLIVRAHPAEAGTGTRERILDQIAAAWPEGLPGVTLMAPEQPASARELSAMADLVLAYNSTAGLEAAIDGRPVILCGAPHYRGKGFTIDVASRLDYADLLRGWAEGTPIAAPASVSELARRYFHLFFVRYHVPMGWTTSPLDPPYRLLIESADALAPGRNPSLDLVCDAILNGRQVLRPRQVGQETACTP